MPAEVAFTRNLLLAFLPAAVIGAIFIKTIKQVFYHPGVVAVTLVLGGLIMLWVERRTHHTPGDAPGAADDTAPSELLGEAAEVVPDHATTDSTAPLKSAHSFRWLASRRRPRLVRR